MCSRVLSLGVINSKSLGPALTHSKPRFGEQAARPLFHKEFPMNAPKQLLGMALAILVTGIVGFNIVFGQVPGGEFRRMAGVHSRTATTESLAGSMHSSRTPTNSQFVPFQFTPQEALSDNHEFLVVSPNTNTPPRLLNLHNNMAKAMTQSFLSPPNSRISFYESLQQETSPKIYGWRGTIQNIEETPHGQLVTLRVSANLGLVFDSLFVLEQYLVTARGVVFVQAVAPQQPKTRPLIGL